MINFQLHFLFRTLGTPNNDVWPDVENLPDYKSTFPKWKGGNLSSMVKNLDKNGLDLLAVRAMDPLHTHTLHTLLFKFQLVPSKKKKKKKSMINDFSAFCATCILDNSSEIQAELQLEVFSTDSMISELFRNFPRASSLINTSSVSSWMILDSIPS